MNDYIFLADMLNKFSQLTPWVQVVMGICFVVLILGIFYFLKEIIRVVVEKNENKRKN